MRKALRPHPPSRGCERREGLVSRRILVSVFDLGIPPTGDHPARQRQGSDGAEDSGNEPTPEANGYGVGSAARLKLRQQMADVRLDGLLREEQALPDLSIDEAVGDELEDLDLAGGGFLLELAEGRGRRERDHGARPLRVPACRSRLESAAVVAVPVQDLLTLRGVHEMRIGRRADAL